MTIPEWFRACPEDCALPHDHLSPGDVEVVTAAYPGSGHKLISEEFSCCPMHWMTGIRGIVHGHRTMVSGENTAPLEIAIEIIGHMDADMRERAVALSAAWLDVVEPAIADFRGLDPDEAEVVIVEDAIFRADVRAVLLGERGSC